MWVAFWFCRCNFNHMGLIHPEKRIRSNREASSTLLYPLPTVSLLHVLFLGNPFGIFSYPTVCTFPETRYPRRNSGFLISCEPWLWDLGVLSSLGAIMPLQQQLKISSPYVLQMALCRDNTVRFLCEAASVLCRQVKVGLQMSRGEHCQKAFEYNIAELNTINLWF